MPKEQSDLTRDPLIRTFGAVLRSHRETAKLSRPQLAKALGCTPQWIEKLETGQRPPSEATATDLDTYFQLPARTFFVMWDEIKREGKQLSFLPGFDIFIEHEGRANWVRSFVTQVIPGLLQTEAYARGVMGSGQTRDSLDELVTKRMRRQAVLRRDDPPGLVFVLDESVLHRPVGGRAVMYEQLSYLKDVAENSPNIHIGILPFSSITWAGLDGSFTILGFADKSDVVYLEAPGTGQLIAAPEQVTSYAVRFDLVMGEALPSAESLKMITRVLEGYE